MANENTTTPLMKQYLEIKSQYKHAILFFRMGDFYEMFYEDAKVASEVLGITLTSRASGKAGSVPLAGFPYHSLDTYLAKMVKAGYRVAICEQIEDPKLAKKIVKRAVREVVTPGTAIADELLDSRRNNYLCAVFLQNSIAGIATVDVSTGEYRTCEVVADRLPDQLALIRPAELLVSVEQAGSVKEKAGALSDCVLTTLDGWLFNRDYGYEILTRHFKTLTLKGFGCEDLTAGIAAAGAALQYLKENQKTGLEQITELRREDQNDFVALDRATQRNLELLSSLAGQKTGSLLAVLDKTLTAMGARMLVKWLLHPLRAVQGINWRLDAVEDLVQRRDVREAIAQHLRKIGDLERLNTRIAAQRANARDLMALRTSLENIEPVRSTLANAEPLALQEIHRELDPCRALADKIQTAIVDDPPLSITDGGIIRKGFNAELDRLRDIAYSGKDWILRLQESERKKTGIASLKVNYNKVFGYYIEVTRANLSKVPDAYIRKQTLVNAERFITPALKEYEEQILDAEEKIVSLEYELFSRLREKAASCGPALQRNARRLAELDCLTAFASNALENNYCRPRLDESDIIEITAGRHPVVEQLLPFGEKFIPNDIRIDTRESQIQIITGPNMAGKSTYLRQVALSVLMAQIGSFVPASKARIGVVDKIFTRVGASDNLAGGESTFLVEMNEAANILHNATPRSLIILDEIGRGTSTFDGLSIAWSVVEYLHECERLAAKTLFATHYHELTELEMIFARVKNFNIAVKEWGDQIIFLRKIVEGGADHSYGIQVAKLAGLPPPVIARAKEILSNLEQNALTPNHKPRLALKRKSKKPEAENQMDFFSQESRNVINEIKNVDLNNMTPMQALIKLMEMKEKVEGKNGN